MEIKEFAIIYSLAKYQEEDLVESIIDTHFIEKFPVKDLIEKRIFFITSEKLNFIVENNKIILQVPNPVIMLFFICILRYPSRLTQELKNSQKNIKKRIILAILNTFYEVDVFTTISSGKNYPIEFYFSKYTRKFKTHVIHYSQNSIDIQFEDQSNSTPGNTMVDEASLGDIHWVWSQNYANYLNKFNSKIEFRAVGPIIFKIPQVFDIEKKNVITIFDVAPLEKYKKNNFYNDKLAIDFLEDIINLKTYLFELQNTQIRIKPKRQLNRGVHSIEYFDYIEKLKKNSKIEILLWNSNPYEIVAESKLVICIPFTSIALIGKELSNNVIFYFPYQKTLKNPIYNNEIEIIYGFENLKRYTKIKLQDDF